MQKKMIANLVEVPEICREFDIDWTKYETSGGNQWLKFYHEELKPIYAKTKADAEKEIKAIREVESRRIAIRKGLDAASAIGKMIAELKELPDNGISPARQLQIAEWVAATNMLAKGDIFSNTESKKDISRIEEDIKYLKAIEDYFAADFELDAVLYAMYLVQPKFKAKLFRHVMRLLPIVETNRAFINTSKAFLKKETFAFIKPCLTELDKAYSTLSSALRKMKKEAAKGKPGFWESVK